MKIQLSQGQQLRANLPIGQSRTVDVGREIGEIVVGNPDVADVAPLTNQSLYVLGKTQGRTTITVYDAAKEPIGIIEVEVGVDLDDLRRAIRGVAPQANIQLSSANGRLRISGTVADAPTVSRIMEIAEQFGSDQIINAMRVRTSQQVMLEVRFIEANRNAGRELGVDWLVTDGRRGYAQGALQDAAPFISGSTVGINFEGTGNSPFGVLLAKVLDAGVDVEIAIRALEQKGLARRLAEPNLIALSGQTASFLAGGEVPIPIVDSDGKSDIEYKEFGVRLAFTPIVLENGQINLNLRPEVSQPDPTLSVSFSGGTVPAFVTRKTETTVELRDGQSFAVAGLLQSITTKDQNQLPWVGQLPVIGALFRSASFNKQETDLVVIVTPHIVRPANSNKNLKTPLDAARNTNDIEFFMLGMMEVDKKMLEDFEHGAGVAGPFGHIIDLEFGDDYAGPKK
jgi:pilus assembly protein CpaC